ncbi:MAG TPA: ABC transporter permease [Acidimicrobiales bacterium]|jgi:osmoprotectant transport system permease protein|nr:ABC transporter permease [Acidimicrobiales bacterium]
MSTLAANGPDSWLWWDWVVRHGDEIWFRTKEHVFLTVVSVVVGTLLAVPAAILGSRTKLLATPLLLVGGVIYTIPSLALFALLIPWTGLSRTTPLIALTSYTLLILFRNTLTGLSSVPDDVRDAAHGMGYSWGRQLLRIELPLALPAIIAGIRIATVTTIGLVTVAALVAQGGYGQFILDGYQRSFRTPIVLGSALSILLAVVSDVVLVGLQRAMMPWTRVPST